MYAIRSYYENSVERAFRGITEGEDVLDALIAGLIPIMWSTGTGSDVMKRIAAPMVGGVVTSVLMELLVYPVIYDRITSYNVCYTKLLRKAPQQDLFKVQVEISRMENMLV